MKVTESSKSKHRQLLKEGYLQRVLRNRESMQKRASHKDD